MGEPRQVISPCPDLSFSSAGISHVSAYMHVCRRLTCFLGTMHSQEWQFLLRLASAGSFWQRATTAGSDHNSAFPKCMKRSVLPLLCSTPTASACREMTAEAIECLRCAFSARRMRSTDGFPRVSCKMGQDTSGEPREQLESKQLWF